MIVWLVLFVAGGLLLAYRGAPLWAWNAMFAYSAVALGVFELAPVAVTVVAVALAAAWSALSQIRALRLRFLTGPAFAAYRRIAPRMSDTEREAIEAGTVWWDAELFSGRPDWRRLLGFRCEPPDERERAFLEGPVETLCAMLDDWHVTHEREDLPPEVWTFMREERFFGMIIPQRFGGLGFSALGHSAVVMKIASRSVSAAVTVMVPNSLGPAELLLHYGTDAQRAHYLPRLARGDEIPCFALTGPEAGSDASAMPDIGTVCRGEFEGRADVLGIRLNWDKRYITLGPVATLLGLAFKLHDPDRLLGGEERPGITLALIPTSTPGITIGDRHLPMNHAFQNGPNSGRDVFIPVDWIIGGPEMAGKGWRMLMESLAAGRSISLPALSTGSGKVASRVTGAYAAIRQQFRTPVGQFEGVQEALARIAGNAYLMEAARTLTARAVDAGEQPSVLSAIVKYHLTERMRQVINDAMDVHGGRGICMGPRNYLARGYQGVPIAITVEGANILTRSLIIFGQGAIRCHPHVLDEIHAAADPDPARGLEAFDRSICAHVGHVVRNAARCLLLGLTASRLARPPVKGSMGRYYAQMERMCAALAFSSEVAMLVLGGRLKRMERLSARLGDILSNLYLASAVLKRFEDDGRPESDRPLVHWGCRDSLYRSQIALDELLRNFPHRAVAAATRAIVFPLGMRFDPPSDANDRRVARLLLRPSGARDRLTAGIYLGGAADPLGRVEQALELVSAAQPAMRKLQRAIRAGALGAEGESDPIASALDAGVLDPDEAVRLRAADAARVDAIAVDAFAPSAFGLRIRASLS